VETLSFKYICKLSALGILLTIGFIFKVPVSAKKQDISKHQVDRFEENRFSMVVDSQTVTHTRPFDLNISLEESNPFIIF
jgi:hypothetical protein